MAMDINSNEYKQAVASKGGSFDSKGAETTENTWGTEAVNPNDWQNGGWYTNPNSGRVEQWWANGGGSGGSSSGSSWSAASGSFDRMDRNANPGDAYFWDAADGWKLKDGGSTGLPQRPTVDLAGQYKSLYDQLGIQSYRDQMNDYTNQLNAMQEEMTGKLNDLRAQTDEAAALINENPWASAANRSGRLAKLEQQYNNKAQLINNEYANKVSMLQNNMANTNNQYQMAMSDLDSQMNIYNQQYQYDLNNFDQNLAQLNTLIDRGALDNASMDSLNSIASQLGLSSNMISSMITAQKNSRMNPTLLTNTDDYGNVTATLIDANTGNIINQQKLQGVAASNALKYMNSKSGSGSGSGLADVNKLLSTRETLLKQGLDTSMVDAQLEAMGMPISENKKVNADSFALQQNILTNIENLKKDDAYTGITGLAQSLPYFGKHNDSVANYNALLNNMVLLNTGGKLGGQVSDSDVKLLQSTTGLNRSLSNDQFLAKLNAIEKQIREETFDPRSIGTFSSVW